MPTRSTRAHRRLSVTTYLLAAFGTCTVFLVLVLGQGTLASFDRERAYARHDLRAITRETQNASSGPAAEVGSMADGILSDPRVAALDPAQCLEVFGAIESFLVSEHIHLFRLDGTEVCSVYGTAAKPVAPGTAGWLADVVRTGRAVESEPSIDPATDRPGVQLSIPVKGPTGGVIGALAFITDTGRSNIAIPPDAPRGAVILLVDRRHDLVLGASANAPASVGDKIGGTSLGQTLRAGHAIRDLDGKERIYEDVTIKANGWHVLAGVTSDVALAPARAQMRRNAAAGAATLGIVLILGWMLHRRLARPIRRVGRAISDSLDGNAAARAPLDGPSELAHVANVFNDLIEERQVREADLWHRARHDALTGLPNRTMLTEHLNEALETAEGTSLHRVVVVFLDLDRFKHINDAYGHATGDRVLVSLGERLRETMADVFVSRFGGDEYVMVATGHFDSKTAAVLALQVAATMHVPVEIDGADLHLTGSVGIAIARRGDTAEDLIRNADTAMYRSKEQGVGGYAVFDQPMRDWVMHRATIEQDLHQALDRGELWLSYQPKLALAAGGSVGFEALARWDHPERGLIPPAEFIPIAEESGLISAIGAWALEEATRQAATWRVMNGGLAVPVAVNLAARQLADPKLPDLIAQILDRSGAQPSDLVLEVTESAVLFDTEGVSKRLRRLRDAGVRISIDDFGTGYSSLSYLQQLPIDELKIDRAFVSRLPFERSSTAIIGSVIDLAHAIGLDVVAEGVETVEQFDVLRDLGCDLAQGFYIARPAPAMEATTRLRAEIRSSVQPTTLVAVPATAG